MIIHRRGFFGAFAAAALAARPAPALAQGFGQGTSQEVEQWYPLLSDEGEPVANLRLPVELFSEVEDLPGLIRAGAAAADVTVVEFFDYNCPFCRKAAGDLDALLETDGELRLGLVNNPILSPASKEAAAVEYAVLSQRPEAAYDFFRALFRARGTIGRERALAAAADLGLDRAAVAREADAGGTAEALERQLKLAASMGFSATPSFVISGTGILGYPGPKSLAAIIASVRRCDTVAC